MEKITHYDVYEEFRKEESIALPLVANNNRILHTKTKPFDFANPPVDPAKLRDSLIVTMYMFGGLGLAANQIGVSLSVFVLRPDLACFNPEIIKYSDETVLSNEGCLSYPLLYLPIRRSRAIIVSFYDEKGEQKQDVFEGLSARCFQHELDHLNGINYQTRCDTFHRNKAVKSWKKFSKDKAKVQEIVASRGEAISVSVKRNFSGNTFIYSS